MTATATKLTCVRIGLKSFRSLESLRREKPSSECSCHVCEEWADIPKPAGVVLS